MKEVIIDQFQNTLEEHCYLTTNNPTGIIASIVGWYIRHIKGETIIWIHNASNDEVKIVGGPPRLLHYKNNSIEPMSIKEILELDEKLKKANKDWMHSFR